ncbi:PadR family transcriptional regulator [Actinoplanes missouriensis]|uniref:PadR family transcriptional regulator n=1 Tax=Actinoplanes missouriensis TaxID=1866 RepID=UPI003F4CE08E
MRYDNEGERGHGMGFGRGHGRGGWASEGRRRGFGFPPGFPFGSGPGGPGFPPHDFGGGPRPRRGGRGSRQNVRPAILALLLERPMHGYEMIQELDARTNGIWRPSPGSVYPTLQLLEDEGLIEATADGGRKSYQLTSDGRPEAEAAAQNPPWSQFGAETMSQVQDFRDAAVGIMGALKQVGFSGTPEQRQKALEVLNETKRKLYAILADSE